MLEKIKDFFRLNCEVIGHSSAPEDVDLLNQILHDMGAVLKKVSGRPTSCMCPFTSSAKRLLELKNGNMEIFLFAVERD